MEKKTSHILLKFLMQVMTTVQVFANKVAKHEIRVDHVQCVILKKSVYEVRSQELAPTIKHAAKQIY